MIKVSQVRILNVFICIFSFYLLSRVYLLNCNISIYMCLIGLVQVEIL